MFTQRLQPLIPILQTVLMLVGTIAMLLMVLNWYGELNPNPLTLATELEEARILEAYWKQQSSVAGTDEMRKLRYRTRALMWRSKAQLAETRLERATAQ